MSVRRMPPEKIQHLDVDTSGRTADDAVLWDGTQHIYGAFADQQLDYLTFTDTATGDIVQVAITSGAWVFTTIEPRITESGGLRVTEGGDVRILE
jgi:hypothetical protein